MTKPGPIIACLECDRQQHEVTPPLHGTAQCVRCGAELYRNKPHSIEHTLGFLVAAAFLFVIANTAPLLALDAQGVTNTTTLFGASHALYATGDEALAVLVFMTTILFPGLEIASMIYVLATVESGRPPRLMAVVLRFVEALKPWGMISVFMLGTLVSLVKLHNIASVIPGLGLYAVGVLILMLTASEAAFEPRELWARVEALRAWSPPPPARASSSANRAASCSAPRTGTTTSRALAAARACIGASPTAFASPGSSSSPPPCSISRPTSCP
jgi:paraquat-inducible protein A